MFKLVLEKAEEPEIKLPTSTEKAREFQKNIYFCFIDYAKVFDCVDHNKLWKILKEMGIPDHLTCLLINLYAGQEATVKKLVLEKAEEPEIKMPTFVGSSKKQESSRKTSALLTTPKPLTVWITTNCGKFFKRWEYQTCLLRNLYAGQEATTVTTGYGATTATGAW